MCFKCPSKEALLKITSPLGSKTHSDSFLENLFTSDMMDGLSQIHFQHERGHPQPTVRTGYDSQVSIWAREKQFQSHTLSTHRILRPVLTVSKGLKQASTIVAFQFTLLWERSGADYKGPHWYKRERSYQTFQTLMRTKGPLFCHIQMRPQMTTGSKQQWLLFCILFFFLNFLFNRALHWSVQKLN